MMGLLPSVFSRRPYSARTTLRTLAPPTSDREYTPARSTDKHRPEAHWRSPTILSPAEDSHGDDVLGGLNERDVQERRQPTARLDLGPGPVGVVWPRAVPGRHGTLGLLWCVAPGPTSCERPAT